MLIGAVAGRESNPDCFSLARRSGIRRIGYVGYSPCRVQDLPWPCTSGVHTGRYYYAGSVQPRLVCPYVGASPAAIC